MAKAAINPKKPRAKREKKAKVVDTRESLTAEMGVLLDRVDHLLPTLKVMNWRWGSGPLAKEREEMDAIEERMRVLLEDVMDVEPAEVFFAGLARPGGTVPSLARPGSWVEWIGYVPVLVYMGWLPGHHREPAYVRSGREVDQSPGLPGLPPLPEPRRRGPAADDPRRTGDEHAAQEVHALRRGPRGKDDANKALADNEWPCRIIEAGAGRSAPDAAEAGWAVQLLPFA